MLYREIHWGGNMNSPVCAVPTKCRRGLAGRIGTSSPDQKFGSTQSDRVCGAMAYTTDRMFEIAVAKSCGFSEQYVVESVWLG